jgi:hypothetical protein
MKRQLMRVVALVWMALAIALPAGAQDPTPASSPVMSSVGSAHSGLHAAATWLMDQQLEDGAFAGFSGEADAGTTVDAMIALVAASEAGIDTGTAIDDAVAYLASGDVSLVYEQIGVGQAAKLVLALIASGEDPEDFAGYNPIAIVENGQDEATGLYGTGIYDHAYALLALSASDIEVPATALDALVSTQAENGGWAFDGSTDPATADSNTTAMVVQALVALGNDDHETMTAALDFLASTVSEEGAAYAPGSDPDANSTALVLQAMIATGGETAELEAALETFQTESGAYFYQAADPGENLFSTVQAMPAAAGYALPLVPVDEATPVAQTWRVAA